MAKMKMEDSGFAEPVQSSIKVKEVKSPWDFSAPSFDRSKMIQAGDNYGIGTRSPVGRPGNAKSMAATLPRGRVNIMANTETKFKDAKVYEND